MSKFNISKSQVSIEYLVIMGFVALLTIPLLIIYMTSSGEAEDETNARKALIAARKIADTSASIYFLGKPSQTTVTVYFPDRLEDAYLANQSIVFRLKTQDGISDIVQVSSVNMSGPLPKSEGTYSFVVKASEKGVDISYS